MSQLEDHQLATGCSKHFNMKFFIAVLALAAVAYADVSHLNNAHAHGHSGEASAQVLRHEADVHPEGFNYAYETSNGIAAQESGQLKNAGIENAAISVQGSYQYTSPEGQPIQLTYTADENGYQPQGAHLPTPPAPQPIPEYIERALRWIEAHPPPKDGRF